MSEPALLVLAASRYQLPFIQRARELGWRVVTADNCPGNPGHQLAHRSYNISTVDREGILRAALQEGVQGILAACTDVAVPTAAWVADRLGLPGIPPDSAEILCSKIAFRDFQKKNGLSLPRCARPEDRVPDGFWNGCRQWLVKPDQCSGSKGITLTLSLPPAEPLLARAQAASLNGNILIEEAIEGTQVTCEGIILDGEIPFSIVTDRKVTPFPYTSTLGHCLPSSLSQNLQASVVEEVRRVLLLLGIRNSLFDADAVVNSQGIHLIEVSPRAGGNSLVKLVESACGYDWIQAALHLALGKPLPSFPKNAPSAGLIELLGVPSESVIHYDPSRLKNCRRDFSWLVSFEMDLPPGSIVPPFKDGASRFGEIVLTAGSSEEAEERLRCILDHIQFSHRESASPAACEDAGLLPPLCSEIG